MRIQRGYSRLSFRTRRRRAGCVPLVMLMGLLVGVGVLSWNWLERRFVSFSPPANEAGDLLADARAAFERGDLNNAVTRARLALELDPARTDAVALLAQALVYRSYTDYNRAVDREAALELTTEAIQSNPTNADLRAAHAFALQANGQPAAAAEAALRVLADQPEHGLARTALALAYAVAGSHEIALRESERAVRGNPNMVDALRALAISYGDNGNYDSAVRTIESALLLNGGLIPLYFERALYAMQLGDADSATFAYMQVLALDPANVKARLRLCELSSLLRERETAISYCQQVTQLAPTWSQGWHQLGREYFLQGNYAAAQEHLHQCASLEVMQDVPINDRTFACWYLQGQAAEIRGDCPALLATYNEFRAMSLREDIEQTWTYPPEGPAGCR